VAFGACLGEQQDWTPNTNCANLDPPCFEHTGACCDGTTGTCTNGVLSGNCVGDQQSWTKSTSCAAIDPPCFEHTGACCDTLTGSCVNGVPGSLCQGADQSWAKGEGCSLTFCPVPNPVIPTVSEWGLAIMSLLLLVGLKVYFGRREAVA